MFRTPLLKKLLTVLVFGVCITGSKTTLAQNSSNLDPWQYTGSLYLWGAGIQSTAANGSEIDVSFSDILEGLDLTFMGALGGQRGKWMWLADYIYLDLSQDDGGVIPGTGVALDARVKVRSNVFNMVVGRNVYETDKAAMNVVFGTRYLDLKTSLTASAIGPLGMGGPERRVSAGDDNWDAIIGVRGEMIIDDNWFIPYHFDYGAGDSDSTWQAIGGVGYRFGWGDLVGVYRYLDWEFESGTPIQDIAISGPALQARWSF